MGAKKEKYLDNLISVIMPAYNCETTVGRAIESILNQSVQDWELIVVDDASPDNAVELLAQYASKEPRIQVVRFDRNQGAAVARNEGLKRARGRYVAFLDADDYWDPVKLEKQLDFMRENGYGFTYTAYTNVYDKAGKRDKLIHVPRSLDLSASLKNTVIGCLTVMIDREIIGEFYMPEIRSGQDHVAWWRILEQGHIARGLQENLAFYRIGQDTLSSNKLKTARKRWYNYHHVMGLSLIKSIYYFSFYMYHSFRKHYL